MAMILMQAQTVVTPEESSAQFFPEKHSFSNNSVGTGIDVPLHVSRYINRGEKAFNNDGNINQV